jgi:hypothetical protein
MNFLCTCTGPFVFLVTMIIYGIVGICIVMNGLLPLVYFDLYFTEKKIFIFKQYNLNK